MQTLQDAGVNTDTYFQKMADGSYKLIGDAEAFKDAVD
jgi:hypothetical protein